MGKRRAGPTIDISQVSKFDKKNKFLVERRDQLIKVELKIGKFRSFLWVKAGLPNDSTSIIYDEDDGKCNYVQKEAVRIKNAKFSLMRDYELWKQDQEYRRFFNGEGKGSYS